MENFRMITHLYLRHTGSGDVCEIRKIIPAPCVINGWQSETEAPQFIQERKIQPTFNPSQASPSVDEKVAELFRII